MSSYWEDTCSDCGNWTMDCECHHNNEPKKSACEEYEEAIKIKAAWDREQMLKGEIN